MKMDKVLIKELARAVEIGSRMRFDRVKEDDKANHREMANLALFGSNDGVF